MPVRGVRGAITAGSNTKKEIISKTGKLLGRLISANGVKADDIASIVFSATKDLNAEFPAAAARELGLIYTPLMCTHEIAVPGSVKRCIRILMLINTRKPQRAVKNIYLDGAAGLRPDLEGKSKGKHYLSE